MEHFKIQPSLRSDRTPCTHNRSHSCRFVVTSVYQATQPRHLAVQLYQENTSKCTNKREGDLLVLLQKVCGNYFNCKYSYQKKPLHICRNVWAKPDPRAKCSISCGNLFLLKGREMRREEREAGCGVNRWIFFVTFCSFKTSHGGRREERYRDRSDRVNVIQIIIKSTHYRSPRLQ